MDIVLPKEIAYSPSLPALPECLSQEIVLAPVNGATFGPGQLIQFDLASRGFIDPTSIYFRYKATLASLTDAQVKGTPVYTFFSKLETLFGSQIVESINNYGQVCNLWTNMQMDVAMKYGMQSAYGWSTGAASPSIEELDGRLCGANDSFTLAAPLPCILSCAEKLIPAGFMPNIRIQLTTDSIANIFTNAVVPTGYTLSNVELCYTMIDFNGDVNNLVKNMGEQFYVKSTSFQNIGSSLNSGFSGNAEIVYNLRLASIKSLFSSFAPTQSSNNPNGIYDSVDITSNTGEYVYNIAGTYFPARPVSALNNRAGILMELKKAVGALHSESYNSSINTLEFNATDTSNTTYRVPGKFWFGVNTEKLSSNGALLTGISTQNSPITLRITSSASTTKNYTIYLTAMYDVLISVDPHNRQAVVKQ